MGRPASRQHRKLDRLRASVNSKSTLTSSLLQLRTKTQFVFVSLVNHLDLGCDQVDIKAAFLCGDLEETIYLPPRNNIPADKVLHLRKSLYGFKQSPRCFNKAFDEWLRGQGLTPTGADPCIYTRRQGNTFLMLSVHVNDHLIACNSRSALDSFKLTLNNKFECSDSGPAGYSLGVTIYRDRPARKLYNIISRQYLIGLT